MSVQLIVRCFVNLSPLKWLFVFAVVIPYLHFLVACSNFYKRKWWYTLLMGTITWALYLLLVIVISITILLLMIHLS